jgi:adenylate cyclase
LVEFASAVDATRCAIEIQESIARHNLALAAGHRLRFRIGVNLGDVIVQDDDIFGNGVNVAARLEALARPGGILISGDVYRQVRGLVAQGFEDLGEQRVKNIAEPVRVYRVAVDGEASADGHRRRIWRQRPWLVGVAALVVLVAALGWLATDRLRHASGPAAATASGSPQPLALPVEPSIAVLPFVNLGAADGKDYLGDGLAENLISALSSLPDMLVIARSSSFAVRSKAEKVGEVAKELGVRYVVEGSVQVSGTAARITARLIDASSGHPVWNERYDRDIANIFALQDEITLSIVTALQIKLTDGELARTHRRGTGNLQAWLLVSQALDSYMKFTKQANAEARALAERALALDPTYPEALIRLAHTYLTDFQTGWVPDREVALARSIELVQKALALDDSYPDTYVLLGTIYLFVNRHDEAIAFAERAIELSPSHSLARASLAMIENYAGHPEKAIPLLERAMRLSPIYPDWFLGELGRAYLLTGQHDKAIAVLQRRIERNPESSEAQILLAAAYGAAGRAGPARRVLDALLKLRPGYTISKYARGEYYRNADDLNRVLDGLREAGLPE